MNLHIVDITDIIDYYSAGVYHPFYRIMPLGEIIANSCGYWHYYSLESRDNIVAWEEFLTRVENAPSKPEVDPFTNIELMESLFVDIITKLHERCAAATNNAPYVFDGWLNGTTIAVSITPLLG